MPWSLPLAADSVSTRQRVMAVLLAVSAIAAVAVGYEITRSGLTPASIPALVLFYGGSGGIILAFAVWTTSEVGLPSFLLLSDLSWRERLLRWLVGGIGAGVLLATLGVVLSSGAESPLQPWFWRRIQTPLGAALFSARAALLEETFFRVFAIPFLVSMALRPRRYRLRLKEGAAYAVVDRPRANAWLIAGAVVATSLMFALAHPFNPVGAVLLGPLLAAAYLWGGWESAVTAHFVANALLFQFYY